MYSDILILSWAAKS